ncbi:MAG: hypothetical protein Q8R97_03710, partial [Brevundimonas sp.]|nr:hypothetical protein [Brevundimonas sp.]
MFWLVELAIYIGVSVAAMLLTPRPKRVSSGVAPNSLSQFNLPTIEQGTVVPYVVGTVLLDAPAVLWDGNFLVSPVVQDGNAVAWKYHIGMQLGLCLGEIDDLLEIRFDRKTLPGAPIAVGPGNDALMMLDPSARLVRIPQASYADPEALCRATTIAINRVCERPDDYYRVVYGHQIVTGWNDKLLYEVLVGSTWVPREVTIPAGTYGKTTVFNPPSLPESVYELAVALAQAINTEELTHTNHVQVAAGFEGNVFTNGLLLTLAVDDDGTAALGFRILGSPVAGLINPTLGFHHNGVVEASVDWVSHGHDGTLSATFNSEAEKYIFSGGAPGS